MFISYRNLFLISDYSQMQQSDQSQSVGGILLDSEFCLHFLFCFILLLWFLSCLLASICLALSYFILITTHNHIS